MNTLEHDLYDGPFSLEPGDVDQNGNTYPMDEAFSACCGALVNEAGFCTQCWEHDR